VKVYIKLKEEERKRWKENWQINPQGQYSVFVHQMRCGELQNMAYPLLKVSPVSPGDKRLP